MNDVKQIIVIRSDLKMRRGKEISQACHASISFLTRKMQSKKSFSDVELAWIDGSFKKVCVKVESESELVFIHDCALKSGLMSHLIVDAGLTEFNGVPTKTCLAIGPDFSSKIDVITGKLKLY